MTNLQPILFYIETTGRKSIKKSGTKDSYPSFTLLSIEQKQLCKTRKTKECKWEKKSNYTYFHDKILYIEHLVP